MQHRTSPPPHRMDVFVNICILTGCTIRSSHFTSRGLPCQLSALVPVCGLQRTVILWFLTLDFSCERVRSLSPVQAHATVSRKIPERWIKSPMRMQKPSKDLDLPDPFPHTVNDNWRLRLKHACPLLYRRPCSDCSRITAPSKLSHYHDDDDYYFLVILIVFIF